MLHLRSEGLEPPTYKFVACCSIQLSYDRMMSAARRPPMIRRLFPFPFVESSVASEREGFEPSIRVYTPYNGLANRRLQPLGHLSAATLPTIPHRDKPHLALIQPRALPNRGEPRARPMALPRQTPQSPGPTGCSAQPQPPGRGADAQEANRCQKHDRSAERD